MARFLLPIFLLGMISILVPRLAASQTVRPQVSFGDILKSQGQTVTLSQNLATPTPDTIARNRKVMEFLKIIEENGKKSKVNFYGTAATPKPAKSLSDNVAGYFITPVPTLNPKLEEILAKAQNLAIPETTTSSIGQAELAPLKSSYTIAVLGDSMVETMGENMPQLHSQLKKAYPKTNFVLLNYGQGATTIEQGLKRLTAPTRYENRDYPPLLHLTPDIIVVESFAYNHWGAGISDLNRQWLTAVKILDTVKSYSPDIKVILLTTVSPNPKTLGDGKLNWGKNRKWDWTITTKAYLQNYLSFAESSGIPLADAYNPSLDSDGHGDLRFIDPSDNLHPSPAGKSLMAQKIVETIQYYKLIN